MQNQAFFKQIASLLQIVLVVNLVFILGGCGDDDEPVNVEDLISKSVISLDNSSDLTITGDVQPFTNLLGSTGYSFSQVSGLPGCEEEPSSYIRIDSIGPIFGNGFSVAAMVQFEENRYYERVIDFGNGEGENNGLNVTLSRLQTSSDIAFTSWIDSDSLLNRTRGRVVARDVIQNGIPILVVGTISPSGVMGLYVDGVLINSKAGHPVINVPRVSNYIGRSNWCDEDPDFKGRIELLYIFNRDLSRREVESLYDYIKSQD